MLKKINMAKKGDIKDRIGEIYKTNQGYDIEIIEYSGCKNVTVKFKDGVILNNLRYDCITGGRVAKPIKKQVKSIVLTKVMK